jgi:hypothetical protein
MSTAAVEAYAGPPRNGPGYWRLFGVSALAQLAGGVCLFVGVAVLSWTSLVGLNSGSNLLIYAPWVIDGPWGLVASIGWAALVSVLIGSILVARVEARFGVPSSRVLTWASVAMGGYLPWLLTATPTGRLGLSLFLMPAVLRLVAFDGSGQPRMLPPRFDIPRRFRFTALFCVAAVLVGPYALLHPLAVHGTGESGGSFTTTDSGYLYQAQAGQPVQAEVGLQVGVFPITVTAVRLVGLPRGVRLIRIALGSSPPLLRASLTAQLPGRVAARHSLWIGYAVALTRCPRQPLAITRIKLSYRELGLSLTQTVPLAASNTLLTCS